MKREVKETITIEEDDYKLLKREIPVSPCERCPNSIGCCGCSEGRKYKKQMQLYEDAGLVEAAGIMQEVRDAKETLKKAEHTIAEGEEFLQKCGFDLDKLFGDVRQLNATSKLNMF